jgi:hypothetical protein
MSDIFKLSTDQTILGPDGQAVANGQIHFYDRKAGEYAPVYGDAGLTVSLRQPVQADSAGILPAIHLDDAIAYRALITDRDNNRIREIDDVRRHREGIKVLGGIDALKRYCGNDPFVLVAAEGGCPVFYKRLSGCDLPEEKLPEVIRAECGCDCSVAWQLCRNEPDVCDMETAELNCDYHVLVQECPREVKSDDPAKPCHCPDDDGAGAGPVVKKASIGALLSAGARCLPRVCIRHDAPELALVDGAMVYGDREPPDPQWSTKGAFAGCVKVPLSTPTVDALTRHVQLDGGLVKDTAGKVPGVPQITLSNPGPCKRRYEIRAINRLNRANENPPPPTTLDFGGVPVFNANMQTRLGKSTDTRLDYALGVADYASALPWLSELSIADSTMGPFMSGHLGATNADYVIYQSANGYTENSLIVDLNPGQTFTYVVKYHIYWDMTILPQVLVQAAERIHFGTTIMARQVR